MAADTWSIEGGSKFATGGGGGGGGGAAARQAITSQIVGGTQVGGTFWAFPGLWYQAYPASSRKAFCYFRDDEDLPRVLGTHVTNGVGPATLMDVTKLSKIIVRMEGAQLPGGAELAVQLERQPAGGAWLNAATGSGTIDNAGSALLVLDVDLTMTAGDSYALKLVCDGYPEATIFEFTFVFAAS